MQSERMRIYLSCFFIITKFKSSTVFFFFNNLPVLVSGKSMRWKISSVWKLRPNDWNTTANSLQRRRNNFFKNWQVEEQRRNQFLHLTTSHPTNTINLYSFLNNTNNICCSTQHSLIYNTPHYSVMFHPCNNMQQKQEPLVVYLGQQSLKGKTLPHHQLWLLWCELHNDWSLQTMIHSSTLQIDSPYTSKQINKAKTQWNKQTPSKP